MRAIDSILKAHPTIEGAGVRLMRGFGYNEVPRLDPFLLLDDFRSKNPKDFIAGFPWHPHRGIETVTYLLEGEVEHGDSLGNKGRIRPGELQWMTAGGGIIHQEMPKGSEIKGFQLWVNLPSKNKMDGPKYRDIKAGKVPEIGGGGRIVRVVAGNIDGTIGPVKDLSTEVEYLDVTLKPHSEFVHRTGTENKVFAYVVDGKGYFTPTKWTDAQNTVIFREGDNIKVTTKQDGVRFLLISGKPLKEKIAWHGPIVMNTRDELVQAFREYEEGRFVKGKNVFKKESEDFYGKE